MRLYTTIGRRYGTVNYYPNLEHVSFNLWIILTTLLELIVMFIYITVFFKQLNSSLLL
jgi:hypothetical protein